jgi:hypothetical protein
VAEIARPAPVAPCSLSPPPADPCLAPPPTLGRAQGKGGPSAGSMAALELVAMDMKAQGMYVCRTLSFAGASGNRCWPLLVPHPRVEAAGPARQFACTARGGRHVREAQGTCAILQPL